jgi:hypothetical protein
MTKGEIDMPKRNVVNVCTASLRAVQEPSFLIEHRGKIYLTLAVQEFDPEVIRESKDERRAIIYKEMSNLLETEGMPVRLHYLSDGGGVSYANTYANTDASSQITGGGSGEDDDDPNS